MINNFLILLYYWMRTYVLYLITLVTLITLCHQLAHMLKFLDTLIKFVIIIDPEYLEQLCISSFPSTRV